MFYESKISQAFRLGDIIKGFISIQPTIMNPIIGTMTEKDNYKIDINMPDFSVILSPCCSIGDSKITLTPLVRLQSTIFKNTNFIEDPTRINREIEPQYTLSPEKFEKLPQEEIDRILQSKKGYTLLEWFIYEEHDLFTPYELKGIETKYYMIDFRNVYKINCDKIKKPEKVPIESKVLELSIQSRADLREKLSYYYGRIPEEDLF